MNKILFFIGLVTPFTCSSAFISGQQLQELVNANSRIVAGTPADKDIDKAYLLTGYVTGIYDAYEGDKFCPSEGVSKGQITDIVGKFTTNHPEIRHLDAMPLVLVALEQAFPCK